MKAREKVYSFINALFSVLNDEFQGMEIRNGKAKYFDREEIREFLVEKKDTSKK